MARFGRTASPFPPRFPGPKAAIREGLHLSEQIASSRPWRKLSCEVCGSRFFSRSQEARQSCATKICHRNFCLRMRLSFSFCSSRLRSPPLRCPSRRGRAVVRGQRNLASTDGFEEQRHRSTSAAAQNSGTTFKVDVKLVNVFVTVTDEHGAPVGGLTKENFALLEDGKPQNISVFDKESALPLSIVLDIDTSLSTRKDLPLELASARRFAHAILRPVDALSLYGFSEIVNEVVPFTSDLKAIDRGIDRVHMGSATALYDALYLGSQALEPRKGEKFWS